MTSPHSECYLVFEVERGRVHVVSAMEMQTGETQGSNGPALPGLHGGGWAPGEQTGKGTAKQDAAKKEKA